MYRTVLLAFTATFCLACHREPEVAAVSLPPSASSGPGSVPLPSVTASASTPPKPAGVTEGIPAHFKNGGRGVFGAVSFTVRLLPKLIVAGPQPEIEQAQIDVERGSQHGTVQLDTLHKRAAWGDVEFELGYADVYHDDVELTVRRK